MANAKVMVLANYIIVIYCGSCPICSTALPWCSSTRLCKLDILCETKKRTRMKITKCQKETALEDSTRMAGLVHDEDVPLQCCVGMLAHLCKLPVNMQHKSADYVGVRGRLCRIFGAHDWDRPEADLYLCSIASNFIVHTLCEASQGSGLLTYTIALTHTTPVAASTATNITVAVLQHSSIRCWCT